MLVSFGVQYTKIYKMLKNRNVHQISTIAEALIAKMADHASRASTIFSANVPVVMLVATVKFVSSKCDLLI